MSKANILSAVARVWADIKGELEESKGGEKVEDLAETSQVSADELKKIAKWLQHVVTKFSASAAVADGPKDPALKAVAEEVVKAFTAAAGTLLSLRRGAGPSMRAELRDIGAGLAKAADSLGAAVGTAGMAACAGQVLDRVKHFERTPTTNHAAIRRRILKSLSQLRDASKELSAALETEEKDEEEDACDFDDFGDEELSEEERRVVEAVSAACGHVEDILKQASTACTPSGSAGLAELEAVVLGASAAQGAIDGLAAHAQGGLEVEACAGCLRELREAAKALTAFAAEAEELTAAMDEIQAALDAVPAED